MSHSGGELPDKPDVKELYERFGASVYRRCRYFLRNDSDAQDALHDVFLKVVERYDDFKGEASPLTWMVRIATNHCLNILRARKAGWHQRYETTVKVDAAERGPGAIDALERADLLYAVMPKIDRQLQACAVFYFVDEMTQEDAAKAAGVSVPTLRKRLRKFVEVARRELEKMDLDVDFGDAPV